MRLEFVEKKALFICKAMNRLSVSTLIFEDPSDNIL